MRDSSTGNITLYYNGLTDVAQTRYTNGTLDTTLIYESQVSEYTNMILTLATKNTLMLYCLYYEFEEESPIEVPISVGLKQMKHSGNINCENYHQNINEPIESDTNLQEIGCEINNVNSPYAYNCGWMCYSSNANYEYTFKGVKFGIYGSLNIDNGRFDIEFDGENIAEVNTDSIQKRYTLLYESKVYEYKEHIVKIKHKGVHYALYKLVYWPTITAKRKNSTDFVKEGFYIKESDGIGGFREYNNTGYNEKHALIQLKCTRFWIYSYRDGTTTGDIEIQYNGITETIHTELPNQRVESTLIYESPVFDYTSITLTLRTMKVLMLHYIYYEAPDDYIQPIPMSVGLISMYRDGNANCIANDLSLSLSSEINFINIGCDYTYLSSPNAYQYGLQCWSNNANYEYTFKGVKFALYGTYGPQLGILIINYDGKEIEVNQNSARQRQAALYESSVDIYKEHTVKIRPKDSIIELYKLVYWPSMNAKRINASSFKKTSGDFYLESDGIGGTNFRSQGGGGRPNSTFEITFPCSKIWLYGTKLYWCEYIEIIYNNIRKHFDMNSPQQKNNILLEESTEFSYNKLTFKGEAFFDAFLSCIYYHDEPSIFEYINKIFIKTLPFFDIYVPSKSVTKQISQCQFINISEDFDYFVKLEKEILIFDNNFQYDSEQVNPPAPFNICYNGQLTIKNCSFQNSRVRNNGGGNVLYCGNEYNADITFYSCRFINCGNSGRQSIINVKNINSFIKLDNCIVIQNDGDSPPKIIDSHCSRATLNDCRFVNSSLILIDVASDSEILAKSSEFVITKCIFDSSNYPYYINGGILFPLCIDLKINVQTTITFENNVFTNLNKSHRKYCISNNSYRSIFHHFVKIDAHQMINELTIKNVSFINNRCYSLYGGGSGLNILGVPRINFDECKFINNEARQSSESRSSVFDDFESIYNNGDGDGLQIGFRCKMIDVDLKFERCSFIGNHAHRHGGALAIQTFGIVEILHCTFESNEANANFSPEFSSDLLYDNHYGKKNEGRAGAIYINPSYTYSIGGNYCYNPNKYMTEVSIKNCSFLLNSAYDGFAIYIEGDDPGTTFEIIDNNFTNNCNFGPSIENDPNKTVRGVIATEIHSISTLILQHNIFSRLCSKKIIYVDHYGNRIATMAFSESYEFTKSDSFTKSNDFSETNPFTKTFCFTKSDAFSKSNNFIPSDKFTKSNAFTETNPFTKSNDFYFSIIFSKTNDLNFINSFSTSNIFYKTTLFLMSGESRTSNQFSKSSIFSHKYESSYNSVFSISDESFTDSNGTYDLYTKISETNDIYLQSEKSINSIFSKSFSLTDSILSYINSYTSTSANNDETHEIFSYSSLFSISNKNLKIYQPIQDNKIKMSTSAIIGIVIGCITAIAIVLSAIIYALHKRKKIQLQESNHQDTKAISKDQTFDVVESYDSGDDDLDFWL